MKRLIATSVIALVLASAGLDMASRDAGTLVLAGPAGTPAPQPTFWAVVAHWED